MNAFQKLTKKVKSTKNVGLLALIVMMFIIVLISVVALSGTILLFGLNLVGLEIPYTFKTIIGAGIVLFCLRPSGMFNSKKE